MSKMHKEDWNPREWQGRSRKQVESDTQVAMWVTGGLLLLVLGLAIAEVVRVWLSWQ